jgi:lipopolysaccharide/colanic/teichoic acid biosynthesis glycosyltransferase
MIRYRMFLIAGFAWFVLLFNIERLNLFASGPLALDSSVYILAIGLGLAILLFPGITRQKEWTVVAAILASYVIVGLLFRPGWEERSIPLFLLDVVALGITALIVHYTGKVLVGLETSVESFILGEQGARILSTSDGAEQTNHELYRARRFERPVAIVYCRLGYGEDAVQTSPIAMGYVNWYVSSELKKRMLEVELAKMINSLTYKGDIIIHYKNGLVVCLPETNAEEAEVFVRQLYALNRMKGLPDLRVGYASFPENGLIFEDLVKAAEEKTRAPAAIPARVSHSEHNGGSPAGVEEDVKENSGETRSGEGEVRTGDVWIDSEKRIQMIEETTWVSRLQSQTRSSRQFYLMIKQAMDVVGAALALLLLLPVFGLIILAIYLDDRGTAFYVQKRTGYGGKSFRMYKFRTMVMNAETIPAQKVVTADGTVRYLWPDKIDNDPRITRVGRFLRKTSLDELPQLVNVLKGEMSLVGPRPTSWEVDKYTLHQTERLTVKPGITGLWQVCARETKNFDERLLWDMYYVNKLCFALDIQIMWRTVIDVVAKKGT